MQASTLYTASKRWSLNMDRDEYLERYTQLSLQSAALRQRLSINSPMSDGLSLVDSMSPAPSPTDHRPSISTQSQLYSFPSSQAWPKPQAAPESWKSAESEQVDEATLYEINHQIKCLLTDLLNCESVKSDKMYRTWVQARLMDAEHELKKQRRRRSSAAQETMRTIGLSNGLSSLAGCRATF